MKHSIVTKLSEEFYQLCDKLGFSTQVSRTINSITEVYAINNHFAIQLEIDLRENDLFVYLVYLKDGTIPDVNTIYSYDEGYWCRKYLEEIYKTNNSNAKKRKQRYSETYLLQTFSFYIELLKRNPEVITTFIEKNQQP